jgi:hypothetical protein
MPRCPRCKRALTDEEVRSMWASRNAARATPHGGPGRPRTAPRCACGEMTLARAAQRKHVCGPEAQEIDLSRCAALDTLIIDGSEDNRTVQIVCAPVESTIT